MLIVGERINASRKLVNAAVCQRDVEHIKKEAVSQSDAGADFIDVNVGTFVNNEGEMLEWVINVVQGAVDKPLCLDSPNPDVLIRGLKLCKNTPMINSISGEPGRYEKIVPLVKEFDTNIVVLCIGEQGMPSSVEERVNYGSVLIDRLVKDNVAVDKIYVDPLIIPLGTDNKQGAYVLETLRVFKAKYPGIHFICGLSNISYGLPNRWLINQVFLVSAMAAGLDGAILDPTDKKMMANLYVANAILGNDEYCMNYISAHREGKLGIEK
ncbi:MAG: dihydropteroate synthase [Elusimicrobiota bacterium]